MDMDQEAINKRVNQNSTMMKLKIFLMKKERGHQGSTDNMPWITKLQTKKKKVSQTYLMES